MLVMECISNVRTSVHKNLCRFAYVYSDFHIKYSTHNVVKNETIPSGQTTKAFQVNTSISLTVILAPKVIYFHCSKENIVMLEDIFFFRGSTVLEGPWPSHK
jgi:hypothetical protein